MNSICKLLASASLALACLRGAADIPALMVGDSMMKNVGRALKKSFDSEGVGAESFASIGTGLARLDLFDWNAKATELAGLHHPKVVVIMMGANDNQPLLAGGKEAAFGSAEWDAEYGRRVTALLDIFLKQEGTRVHWIGLPIMREEARQKQAQKINALARTAVEAKAGRAVYHDVQETFARKGQFSPYILQSNGSPLPVREADGIHLNYDGAKVLATQLLPELIKGLK